MYYILVVDDEPKIVELLQIYLEMQGYKVICAYDGIQGWEAWKKYTIDIVLTDIMMPKIDGYSLVKRIRAVSNVPILFLTAKTDIVDKVKGLQMGADDYILKPFDPLEVVTRVSANLRRCYGYGVTERSKEYSCGNLRLDTEKCQVFKNSVLIELTALEYRILQFLMENQGSVLTKNQIYAAVWKENQFTDDNSIITTTSDGKLSIKGYENANQGQMLVKDETVGLTWVDPLSPQELHEAVAQATIAGQEATKAGNSAVAADTSAQTAERINQQTMNWVNNKFWWGTLEEYNALEEINEGTFYFIQL